MSSQKKTIVIVGATGAQGSSVVNTFLSSKGWHVRAVTRSPSSAKAKALQSRGAEVVAADSNDPSTLRAAFKGAHAIFAVTDIWALVGQAATDPSVLKPGQPAIEYAFEKELQQGKNFFDVTATIPTLERLVFSALAQPSKWSNGKYTYGLHFEAKGMAVEYGRTTYPELWAKTSIIQVGFYLENFLREQLVRPRKVRALVT